MVNRRKFVVTLIAGSAIFEISTIAAQTKLDEKDPQATALGYVAKNFPSTRRIRNAQTASFTSAKQPTLSEDVLSLQANKSRVRVGAAHGSKRPKQLNSSTVERPQLLLLRNTVGGTMLTSVIHAGGAEP
jgi:hypothetical protein